MKWDWRAVLGVAISAFLIWWVLRGEDLVAVASEIRHANWYWLIASVVVATSGFLFRAARWGALLHPIRPEIPFRSRYAAVNIGFAMNNLLPARLGEFARAWSIAKMERLPISGAIGSLVAERFLDAVAVFALFALALFHPSFPEGAMVRGESVASIASGLLVLMGIVLASLVVLLVFPRHILGAVRWGAARLPGRASNFMVHLVSSFIKGLEALRDPRLLLRGLAWSFAFWGWNGVSFWLAFKAFGIEEGYFSALFVQAVIAIGVAVPAAPGFFGTFHAAAVAGLHGVYGASEAATLAFAFGYHLGGFIPVTLMGLWYAGRLGVSISEIGKGEPEEGEEEDRDVPEQGGSEEAIQR
jgi:uncharacterized protein (TIRG00374 family)